VCGAALFSVARLAVPEVDSRVVEAAALDDPPGPSRSTMA